MKKEQAEQILKMLDSIYVMLSQLTFHILKEDTDRKIKENNIIQKSNTNKGM
jgi:hypothetical protein